MFLSSLSLPLSLKLKTKTNNKTPRPRFLTLSLMLLLLFTLRLGSRRCDFSPFLLNPFVNQHLQITPVLSQIPQTQWSSSLPVGPQASPRWQNTTMDLLYDPPSLHRRKEGTDLEAGSQFGARCVCVQACVRACVLEKVF